MKVVNFQSVTHRKSLGLSLGDLYKWETFMLQEFSYDMRASVRGPHFPRGYFEIFKREIVDLKLLIAKKEKQENRRLKIRRWFAFFKRFGGKKI